MNKNLKKIISTVAALAITATSGLSAFAIKFSDVVDTAEYKTAVDNLVALGIVNGYEDGTYKPENLIKRSEASKMIVGTMGPAMMEAAEASKGATGFTDVTADHWASGFIAQGVSKGYINGMGDGTFAPDANVTYAQIVKMLVCVLGYTEDAEVSGGFPNGYINQGSALGITDGVTASADTAVNRGQVAMLINNALDIPIKAIVGYEPGFKMVDGQLVSTNIPKTEVYDGKGDSEKYETLLTTFFKAYSVRGRITDTANKAEGTVDFEIEFAENFDGEVDVYNGKKDKNTGAITTTTEEVIFADGLNVDELLCAYSDAIIMENEDGDWELISIAPYGKNEVVELSSSLYVENSLVDFGKDGGVIEFYQSKTSSRTDEYELDQNVVVYVNGVKKAASQAESTVENYLKDPTAEFAFVNTPAAGSKTVDSKVDYIMITSYVTAFVDEVLIEEDEVIIYLTDATAAIAQIKLDLDAVNEGKANYIFEDKDGNEVKYEEIVANDVLTIYASTDDFSKLEDGVEFLNVTVTRDVKSGKITRQDEDEEIYELAGEEYGFAGAYVKDLSIGDDYTFYLNKFGDIAFYEKTASVVNYGIINKIWENNNGEKVVRMVDANGAIVTYEFNKATDYTDWKAKYDALDKSKDFDDATEKLYEKLIVTYKVNANDKIYNITSAEDLDAKDAFASVTAEFSEKSLKVGAAKISENTKIIDFTQAKTIWEDSLSGKVSTGAASSFVDGEEYTVIYGGSKFTDGTYPFVIVTTGVARLGAASKLAVVKSCGSSINEADGISYFSAVVLQGKEEKTIHFESDTPKDANGNSIAKGTVIIYAVNGEGLVEDNDFAVLYDAETVKDLDDALTATASGIVWDATSAPWDAAKYGTGDKQAQLGFGILVDKTASDITVATVVEESSKKISKASSFVDFDIAAEANIYVYDLGIGKGDKMSAGSMAHLAPTKLASKFTENDDYEWGNAGVDAAKTVFFKTYEDEITDIIVIIPEN